MVGTVLLLDLCVDICVQSKDDDVGEEIDEADCEEDVLVLPVNALAELHCPKDDRKIRYHARHDEECEDVWLCAWSAVVCVSGGRQSFFFTVLFACVAACRSHRPTSAGNTGFTTSENFAC